ncbi:MAG: DUF167 domain-containing protein, partial [Acidimicrobiia bacterium]
WRHHCDLGTSSMITQHPDGVLIDVWVVAGASKDEVGSVHQGALRVRTTKPPEAGKANRAIALLVVRAVGGKRGAVISGTTSRRKRVLVEGVTMEQAAQRLG